MIKEMYMPKLNRTTKSLLKKSEKINIKGLFSQVAPTEFMMNPHRIMRLQF